MPTPHISIQLNGSPRQLLQGSTVADLLVQLEVSSRYCAVERNESVVPREQHADTILQDADRIEVVTLVGGG